MTSIFYYQEKRGDSFFSLFFYRCFSIFGLLLETRIVSVEREARRATMDAVLGTSITRAVLATSRPTVLLGLVLVSVRSALQLRELEPTVAALEERTVDVDMCLFFFFRARIIRAALTAAVRHIASFACVFLFYEVLALDYEKAKTAVEAKLAVHGFLDWLTTSFVAVCSFNFFIEVQEKSTLLL